MAKREIGREHVAATLRQGFKELRGVLSQRPTRPSWNGSTIPRESLLEIKETFNARTQNR
jgi:hypothetical protein